MTPSTDLTARRRWHADAWAVVARYAQDRSRAPGLTDTNRAEWLAVARDASHVASRAERAQPTLDETLPIEETAVGAFLAHVGRPMPPPPADARAAQAGAYLDDADDAVRRVARTQLDPRPPTAATVRELVGAARSAMAGAETVERSQGTAAASLDHARASVLHLLDVCRTTSDEQLVELDAHLRAEQARLDGPADPDHDDQDDHDGELLP